MRQTSLGWLSGPLPTDMHFKCNSHHTDYQDNRLSHQHQRCSEDLSLIGVARDLRPAENLLMVEDRARP